METEDADALWTHACKHLQSVLHRDVFSRWIAVINPVSLHHNCLTLAVDNDFYQTWLEDNYMPLIKKALATVNDQAVDVRFTIKEHRAEPETEEPPQKKLSFRDRLNRRSRPSAPSLNPKFTFDTFIVGPSNSFSHAASQAVAQSPARAYNPLFIYGDVGLGKTHLMQAVGHYVMRSNSPSVRYLSCEALMNEYIDALTTNSLVQFRRKYRSADVLLVDDIHFLGGKERLQEEFFHTFNVLFDSHKQIVMTSDRPASEITGLEHRLVSRFEWGLVTELESPDLETRIAILRNKQRQTNVKLPDSHLVFIAENIRSNVRRLEGALVRAISYASLTGRELTMDNLKHLLRDTLEKEQLPELNFETIQRAVADHFDVRISDLSSKRRPREIAVPRQVAMFLCRSMTRASLPDIANAFCKTHATVLHAYKTINNRLTVDEELQRNVTRICDKLGRTLS